MIKLTHRGLIGGAAVAALFPAHACAQDRARLWKPDFGYLATQQAAVFDFWNKDFKR
jgi:hypothetical protein